MTEIVKHTSDELIPVISGWKREDLQAVCWLFEAGLPVGFVGPALTFSDQSLLWVARLYWELGTRRVIALANSIGEICVIELRNSFTERTEQAQWIFDREDWRAAIIAAVDRLTVCDQIERDE